MSPSNDHEQDDSIDPEIAADDAGASAAAERLQKIHDRSKAANISATEAIPTASDGSELLIDGQEEVFSRSEVEMGRVEHHSGESNLSGRDAETPQTQRR